MGMTRSVVFATLLLFAAACSDAADDPLGVETTSSANVMGTEVSAPDSSASADHSEVPGGTATEGEDSVTTTLPTTTVSSSTSTTSTSTTAPAPTPTWADQPLVVTGSWMGALGWWDGAQWVQVRSDTVLPVRGGEDYKIVLLGNDGLVTGGSQLVRCDFTVPTPGVKLENGGADRLIDHEAGLSGIAVSAPWDLTPHLVEEFTDNGTYAAAAADILAERGLTIDEPVVRQLIRLDLEGDGLEEVLVVVGDTAEETNNSFGEAQPGDYSLVFLRRLTDSGVSTWVLAESVATGNEPIGWSTFTVSGVADLSGDSKMEIIVSGSAWENQWVTVFEYIDDAIGPDAVMSAGCGV